MEFPLPSLLLLSLAGLLLPATAAGASRSSRAAGALPLATEIQLHSGERPGMVVTRLFADGFLALPAADAAESPPADAPAKFIPWGTVDLGWLQTQKTALKPPRAISEYGGERLLNRAVWLDVTRDEAVAPRDTALRILLRRTTGNPGDTPVELECIFLKPDTSHFAVITRRIDPLALPLGQSVSLWCAPKSPLLRERLTLQPPSKSYKRPIHWIVRVRSHRQVIATATSDRAVAAWAQTAHFPDPRSPFGGAWRNYGQ